MQAHFAIYISTYILITLNMHILQQITLQYTPYILEMNAKITQQLRLSDVKYNVIFIKFDL